MLLENRSTPLHNFSTSSALLFYLYLYTFVLYIWPKKDDRTQTVVKVHYQSEALAIWRNSIHCTLSGTVY